MTASVSGSEDDTPPTPSSVTTQPSIGSPLIHSRVARAFHVLTSLDVEHKRTNKHSPLSAATVHSLSFARSLAMSPLHTRQPSTHDTAATAIALPAAIPASSTSTVPLRRRLSLLPSLCEPRMLLLGMASFAALVLLIYTLTELTRQFNVSFTRPPQSNGHTLAQWRSQHPAAITASPATADHTFYTDATTLDTHKPTPHAATFDSQSVHNNVKPRPAPHTPSRPLTNFVSVQQYIALRRAEKARENEANGVLVESGSEKKARQKQEMLVEADRLLRALQDEQAELLRRQAQEAKGVAVTKESISHNSAVEVVAVSAASESSYAQSTDSKAAKSAEHVVQQQRVTTTKVRSLNDASLQSLRWPAEDGAHT